MCHAKLWNSKCFNDRVFPLVRKPIKKCRRFSGVKESCISRTVEKISIGIQIRKLSQAWAPLDFAVGITIV